MTTKVNGANSGAATQVGTGQGIRRPPDSSSGEGSSGSAAAAAGAPPSVSITDSARQLAALEQAVNAAPVVNSAKVAKIAKAVDDGTYTVDAGKTADKLMQMEQSLSVAGPATE
jgi:negative regulator of flagellin synthesis FlgM